MRYYFSKANYECSTCHHLITERSRRHKNQFDCLSELLNYVNYNYANPVQHEVYFSVKCIWELVEPNTMELTFIFM